MLSRMALILTLLASSAAAEQGPAPEIMFLNGVLTGTVNGTQVNFDITIELNLDTGEETATVANVTPAMGAILRQVTAMVTVGGPTGGKPIPPLTSNLFDLSGGNFSNLATVFWPDTKDTVEVIHNVSYQGDDTMTFVATMNGTVPVISIADEVVYSDFEELLVPAAVQPEGGQQQLFITGVGFQGDFSNANFREYSVGNNPPVLIGKGSDTTFIGDPPPDVIVRSARNISSTYDQSAQTINIHLFNELSLMTIFADGFEAGNTSAWGGTFP